MKRPSRLLMFFFLICLQGCYPSFDHAVVDPKLVPRDDRLIGLWEIDGGFSREQDKNAYGFLLFLPCEQVYCLTMYSMDEKESGVVHFTALAGVIDGVGYMNYKEYDKLDDEDAEYELARYEISGEGLLRLRLTDKEKVRQAITDDMIEGEIEEGEGDWAYSTVHVTSGPEALAEMLKKRDVFSDEPLGVFREVPDGLSRALREHLPKSPPVP